MSYETAEVAPGVRLRVALPDGGEPEDPAAFPAFQLGPVSGARVTLRSGHVGAFGLLRVACAWAPARSFAPGVEELVFGRATQIARAVVPAVTGLDPGPTRATATGFEQRLSGEATVDGAAAPLRVRHLLGFAARDSSAVLCSIACVERVSGACAAPLDRSALEGELAAAPPPSLAVRALFLAVEHPAPALAAFAALVALAIVILLARRPRSISRRVG